MWRTAAVQHERGACVVCTVGKHVQNSLDAAGVTGAIKGEGTWSEQELLICLTIKEHIFPYVIWPVAMSMTPDTWTNVHTKQAVGTPRAFCRRGQTSQPANQHRFHREWRDLYAELF